MATVKAIAHGKNTIDTTLNSGTLEFGNASAAGVASTWAFHIVNDNTFSGTIIVKGRSDSLEAGVDNIGYVAVNYVSIYLNGAVSDQTYKNTTITTTSLILVPSTGQSIAFAITCASGSCSVYARPVVGAAG